MHRNHRNNRKSCEHRLFGLNKSIYGKIDIKSKKNKVMNLLDKYILLEANTVSDAEYKKMTGNSLEDFRVRMRQHIAETKARVEAAKSK